MRLEKKIAQCVKTQQRKRTPRNRNTRNRSKVELQTEKRATWKEFYKRRYAKGRRWYMKKVQNKKKVQHEKSTTQKRCKMEIVQHKKGAI